MPRTLLVDFTHQLIDRDYMFQTFIEGDPMADWTMFILAHAKEEECHAHFWRVYGKPEDNRDTRFRKAVYDGMHAATALVWSVRNHDEGTVQRAYGTLREVAKALPALIDQEEWD